jgi:uncharacterized protein YcfL
LLKKVGMKNKTFFIISSLASFIAIGCGNNNGGNTNEETALIRERSKLKINSVYRIKRDNTYVDLIVGKKFHCDGLSK